MAWADSTVIGVKTDKRKTRMALRKIINPNFDIHFPQVLVAA
jgi:hypothetical protein